MTIAVHAGERRHVLSVEQATITRDSVNQEIETWAEIATIRASMHPVSGNEFFAAQTTFAETTARFRTRYNPDLNLDDKKLRLVDRNGGIWDVEAVLNLEFRDRDLEIVAVRRG